MFSEQFRLIKHSQIFPIFKKLLKFDVCFLHDYEQFKNVPGVFSTVPDAMPIEFRMKK